MLHKATSVSDFSVLRELAPCPRTLADTGLSDSFLAELILKHLHEAGVLSLAALVSRICLPGNVLDEQLAFLRREAQVEVRSPAADAANQKRYALTDRGRVAALDAMMRSGYVGPAPVPLQQYTAVSEQQTVHADLTTRSGMEKTFEGVVLQDGLMDQLGAAMNSGRAIFIYGPAGTGKTYITQRLARLLSDTILVPYALAVGDAVVEMFDPVLHKTVEDSSTATPLSLDAGADMRYARCQRPVAIAGGELTLDMLEVRYDSDRRTYRAPLQLRANNGLFIIDDMGRQRADPTSVLNRWIVPLEEARDFLHLGTGVHFAAPFDLILVFSTNLNPLDLADEAFLRRIGYKIRFDFLERDGYTAIWRQNCTELGLEFDPTLVEYTIDELHRRYKTPLTPCHPRDLLNMALDRANYLGQEQRLETAHIDWAWRNYFVNLKQVDPEIT